MAGVLAGLKIEDDKLFTLEENDKDWADADIGMIGQIENLLKKLENCKYPDKSKREDIMFDREYVLGSAYVKASKDEDGDFTVHYKQDAKPIYEINEDAAFGLDMGQPIQSDPVNSWEREKMSKKAKLLDKSKTVANSRHKKESINEVVNAEESDESSEKTTEPNKKGKPSEPIKKGKTSEPIKKVFSKNNILENLAELSLFVTNQCKVTKAGTKRSARKSTAEVSVKSPYKKRDSEIKSDMGSELWRSIRTALANIKYKNLDDIDISKKLKEEKISFISKKYNRKNILGDSSFFISNLRYHAKFKISDVFESNFYLIELSKGGKKTF